PAVSPAVPPPGWEGGAAGPPPPSPPPGRRGREEGPGTTSALAENLGRSTTGRVGTGWNVTRRVSVSKVRNPLSLCDSSHTFVDVRSMPPAYHMFGASSVAMW